jgi:hypothetical protein
MRALICAGVAPLRSLAVQLSRLASAVVRPAHARTLAGATTSFKLPELSYDYGELEPFVRASPWHSLRMIPPHLVFRMGPELSLARARVWRGAWHGWGSGGVPTERDAQTVCLCASVCSRAPASQIAGEIMKIHHTKHHQVSRSVWARVGGGWRRVVGALWKCVSPFPTPTCSPGVHVWPRPLPIATSFVGAAVAFGVGPCVVRFSWVGARCGRCLLRRMAAPPPHPTTWRFLVQLVWFSRCDCVSACMRAYVRVLIVCV